MEIESQDQAAERAELHFLAAYVDELLKGLILRGLLTREQVQQIENAVSARVGSEPRAW